MTRISQKACVPLAGYTRFLIHDTMSAWRWILSVIDFFHAALANLIVVMVYKIQVGSNLAANSAGAALHRPRDETAGNILQLFDVDVFIHILVFHSVILLFIE